jgi:hypothetical protein
VLSSTTAGRFELAFVFSEAGDEAAVRQTPGPAALPEYMVMENPHGT